MVKVTSAKWSLIMKNSHICSESTATNGAEHGIPANRLKWNDIYIFINIAAYGMCVLFLVFISQFLLMHYIN